MITREDFRLGPLGWSLVIGGIVAELAAVVLAVTVR